MAQAQSIFIPKAPTGSDLAALDYFVASDAVFPNGTPDPLPVGRNNHSIVAYPAGEDTLVDFPGLVGKDWGEVTLEVELFWVTPEIAGDVVWFVSWERDNGPPGAANLDADNFAAAKSVVSSAPAVAGNVQTATLLFSQAEADVLEAGDPYRLRIRRDANVLLDTLDGVAQLFFVSLEGTP